MRRPTYRRAAAQRRGPDRRIIAAVAVLIAFGGVIGVTQISNADESKVAACETAADPAAPAAKGAATDPKVGTYTDKNGDVQHKGDGQLAKGEKAPAPEAVQECKEGNTVKKTVNGLEILDRTPARTASSAPHDGFQHGNRCVSTEFGEVGRRRQEPDAADHRLPGDRSRRTRRSPSRSAPATWSGTASSRPARAATTWRARCSPPRAWSAATSTPPAGCCPAPREAADPAPVPAFFVATEDGKGGAQPGHRDHPGAGAAAGRHRPVRRPGPVTARTASR